MLFLYGGVWLVVKEVIVARKNPRANSSQISSGLNTIETNYITFF